jgi:hypothetical protein
VDFALEAAKKGGTIGNNTYMHGIVTYALSEYYTMTQDERVKDAVVQSLRTLISGQGADGGWRYTYPADSSDLSVAAWQVQAMKAGHLTGLKVEGLEGAMDKAMKYIATAEGGIWLHGQGGSSLAVGGGGVVPDVLEGERQDGG